MLSVSRLIRIFSMRTTLPVPTEEVLEVLTASGVRDVILFFEVDIDPEIIKGQVIEWDAPWDDGTTKRFADISTAVGLSTSEKRLVQTKELIHLLDTESARVHDADAIWALIEEVVSPFDDDNPSPDELDHANPDNQSIWSALAVLFPWRIREALLPAYRLRVVGADTIAAKLDLPINYVELVMSDKWPPIFWRLAEAVFEPVFDNAGNIALYDIYIDGKWIGSRRTIEQCEQQVKNAKLA